MKKINIDTKTKGIILFAKGKGGYDDWLVLVTRVDELGSETFRIYGDIFHNITKNQWYFSNGYKNYTWGSTNHWDFFKPTKKQKQIIVDALRERGYKYVPILNKIIYKKIDV